MAFGPAAVCCPPAPACIPFPLFTFWVPGSKAWAPCYRADDRRCVRREREREGRVAVVFFIN